MKPETDREMREWMEDWRDDAPPAAEVRAAILRHVRRRSRTLALVTAGEVIVTILLLGLFGVLLSRARDPETIAVLVAGGLLAVSAFALANWNRRGTWRPSVETTEAFLEISLLRCRRSLRAVRYSYGIMVVEAFLLVPWLVIGILRRPDTRPLGWNPYLFYGALLALIFGAMLLGCRWYARRVRRERHVLRETRRDLLS